MENIDDNYDWVKLTGVKPVNEQHDNNHLEPSHSQGGRQGIYIAERYSHGTPPDVLVRSPTELWLDYMALLRVFEPLAISYLQKSGDSISITKIGLYLTPLTQVVDAFVPLHLQIYQSHIYEESNGTYGKIFSDEAYKSASKMTSNLVNAIKDGSFDDTLKLPRGTTIQLLSTMDKLSRHIPEEVYNYVFLLQRNREFDELISLRDPSPPQRFRRQKMVELMGIKANSRRDIKQYARSYRKIQDRLMRSYESMYGESLKGFSGIVDQDQPFYASTLSRYGLDAMLKYADLGVNATKSILQKSTLSLRYS